MIGKRLKQRVEAYYLASGEESYMWAARQITEGSFQRVLDVGCGNGRTHLTRQLTPHPRIYCGVEAHPKQARHAREEGLDVKSFDLNGVWDYEDGSFDAVHCAQVIEHLHNTRLFLSEMHRVLVPGGLAVLTSENLSSFLNLSALLLGYTPFSLQNVCGWYLGNPLGLHAGCSFEEHSGREMPSQDSPSYSGVSGHVRVLSVTQAHALMTRVGFSDVDVRSMGLMPLPGRIGKRLDRHFPRRGHWLLMSGRKPGSAVAP